MDHSEDDGLWDELNHQHAHEIEQHHHQRNSQNFPWFQLGHALQQTARQTARVVNEKMSGVRIDRRANAAPFSSTYASLSSLSPPHNPGPADIENDLGMNIFGNRQRQQHSRNEPLLYPSGSPPDTRQNNNYMFIQPFRLLPERDGWGAVADLDVFFTSLYQYYNHKGYLTLGIKGAVELTTLFFTLGLSVFLFAYIDWKSLSKCHDESSCHSSFSSYLVPSPLTSSSTSFTWKAWVLTYTIIFLSYGVFSAWSLWHTLQQAKASKWFMEEQLGVGERKLQSGAVDWDQDVVAKIIELQTSGQYRIAIHTEGELDALVIAQRILRKENFMIALFNNPTLLDLSVPFFPGLTFFSKSLEWSLYFCILNFMYNHKYQIRPAFYLEASSLRKRFLLCGIAHVVFMPFLIFFMTLHFMLQHAYDWKSTKHYLGPREWASAAKWTLREFNELPHLFERRMEPSYAAAERYVNLFRQSEIMTAMGRIMVFIGGSLGAVLFAFAAMNDAILLHVKVGDWNLLWFAGLVAGIYSTGKAMIPDQAKDKPTDYSGKQHNNISQEMDAALEEVAKHTHHYPDVWKGRGWDKATTYKAFTKMFQYKAQLFAMEMASIVVAPYVLCVSLPRCAEHICDFVLSIKAEVPGAGEVCGYATFDFDTYGDELWEGRTLGRQNSTPQDHESLAQQRRPTVTGSQSLSESILKTGNVMESTQHFAIPRAREGKMEKSFFSFKAAHPSWQCSESGQDLVNRLERYQNEEYAALSRERQLHVEAAARQLQTLAQLERNRQNQGGLGVGAAGIVVDTATVDESYMRPVNNNPDAGAGSPGLDHLDQRHQQRSHRLSTVTEDTSRVLGPLNGSPDQHSLPQAPSSRRTSQDGDSHEIPQSNQKGDQHLPPPSATPSRGQTQLEESLPRVNGAPGVSPSPNNRPPPPSIFLPPAPAPRLPAVGTIQINDTRKSLNTNANSAARAESVGLSSELQRVLNMSTLDADVGSVMDESSAIPSLGSTDPAATGHLARSMASALPTVQEERERAAEQQYLALERYHSHNAMIASRQPSNSVNRQRGGQMLQYSQEAPPHQEQEVASSHMSASVFEARMEAGMNIEYLHSENSSPGHNPNSNPYRGGL